MRARIVVVISVLLIPVTLAADSPIEPPRGFSSLLNGRDLINWKTDGDIAEHWTVADGVLHYDGKGEREGGTDDALNLVTAKDYRDFELWIDWKIAPSSDSGIYLRGCPQVQIWDIQARTEGSGGLYNNKINPSKPLQPADKPAGQWNTFKIRLVGDEVTVHLNDVLVVDHVTMENYFDRSKPLPAQGPIGLQHHRSEIRFRNIFVKELP